VNKHILIVCLLFVFTRLAIFNIQAGDRPATKDELYVADALLGLEPAITKEAKRLAKNKREREKFASLTEKQRQKIRALKNARERNRRARKKAK
jgi:hypothetical protein